MDDRYETLAERLADVEEELRDLAYERLAAAAAEPDGDGGRAAAAEEKRLNQARRAVAKAIAVLQAGTVSDDR